MEKQTKTSVLKNAGLAVLAVIAVFAVCMSIAYAYSDKTAEPNTTPVQEVIPEPACLGAEPEYVPPEEGLSLEEEVSISGPEFIPE